MQTMREVESKDEVEPDRKRIEFGSDMHKPKE